MMCVCKRSQRGSLRFLPVPRPQNNRRGKHACPRHSEIPGKSACTIYRMAQKRQIPSGALRITVKRPKTAPSGMPLTHFSRSFSSLRHPHDSTAPSRKWPPSTSLSVPAGQLQRTSHRTLFPTLSPLCITTSRPNTFPVKSMNLATEGNL